MAPIEPTHAPASPQEPPAQARGHLGEVFASFLKLGMISFGGPVAHLGYFRGEFVEKRRWVSDADYADLVALCQFLPGPASSQVVFALGLQRAGLVGGVVASLCFTLPSALLMIAFAYGVAAVGDLTGAGWLHGLKLAAVAVVAQAIWGMGKTLCPDRPRITLCLIAAAMLLVFRHPWAQVLAIALGGVAGWTLYRRSLAHTNTAPAPNAAPPLTLGETAGVRGPSAQRPAPANDASAPKTDPLSPWGRGPGVRGPSAQDPSSTDNSAAPKTAHPNPLPQGETGPKRGLTRLTWHTAAGALSLFFLLLVALPFIAKATHNPAIDRFDAFFRAGSLVFGGGHVVLPLLAAEVVPPGWVSDDQFLAGYGAAQAVPGPLFTFAGYLGAAMSPGRWAWANGLWCLLAIFMPAWLLIGGTLPFWHRLRGKAWAQAALRGANAAVVGVLLAALYDPVMTSAISRPVDVAAAVGAFAALHVWKAPPWAVVVAMAAVGQWLLR